MCLYPWNPTRQDPKLEAFRKAFKAKYGEEAETYASHAYDGMNMLIWAVQVAGLNRAKIRDVIAFRNEPWPGVTSDIVFSAVLDTMGEVYLAKRENGAWKYYSRKDLGIPRDASSETSESSTPVPFFDRRTLPTEYAGAGREVEAPKDLKEVRIGYFGPFDPADPNFGDAWVAAQMAVDQANAAGGYQGKPFRLVGAWAKDPWASGITRLARLVYDEKVWAILGGIDGASTHLAEQVANKVRLPLVSPFSTDRTVHGANIPWMFSCTPGDDLQAPVLAEEMAAHLGDKPFVIVSTIEHDPRPFVAELNKALGKRHLSPRFQFDCQVGTPDADAVAKRVVESHCEAVVLAASAADSGRLANCLRAAGFRGLLFGSSTLGQRAFVKEAGVAAEDAVFPLLFQTRKEAETFIRDFTKCRGIAPDYTAARTYDAVRLLVKAIHKEGLNRARIQDALHDLTPWEGIAGTVSWDNLGGNLQTVPLGTIRQGVPVPFSTRVAQKP